MKLRHYSHALGALAFFIATLVAYGWWYGVVGKESVTAVSLASEIETKKQSSARLQEAKQQLEQALTDQAAISGYFVDTDDVVPFLESLQSIGSRLGTVVTVDSVSTQAAKPHALLLLSLHVTGSFNNVERTLGAIEYQHYDTTVTGVTFDTPGSVGGAVPQWSAVVSLRIGTNEVATTTAQKP